MSAVLAPGGWGWKPGVQLTPPTTDDLPDLPLLSLVPIKDRLQVLMDALSPLPFAAKIRPVQLEKKYGLPHSSASAVVARLRGYY